MPKESEGQKDSNKTLSKLTVKKLKALAEKYELDVSDCKKKADYVEVLLGSDKLSEVLKDEELFEKEVEDLERIKTELGETGEDVERIVEEIKELPNMMDEEADTLLSRRMNSDVDFDELEDVLEHIRMRYEERNYSEALDHSLGVKELTSDKLAELEHYLWAYSILSSQKIIEDCGKAGAKIDSAVRLLLSAKDSYKRDDILDNKDLIEDLQNKVIKLLDTEIKKAKKNLSAKEEYVSNAKNLGANVEASKELLQSAKEVLERMDHLRATEHANKAAEMAKESREKRIYEIKTAIPLTQQIINEAKELGTDVEEAERLVKQAENALENEDYVLCSELTKRAEHKAVEVKDTQEQKAMELRRRQMENISSAISHVEPMIREAETHQLDVKEARDLLQRAKLALESQDYVDGTLYVKNAEEIVKELGPEIEKFRTTGEVPRPTKGVCSRCKSADLQFFDNGWGKCSKCGYMFQWKAEEPPKKKKGLFGKLFKKK